MFSLYLHSFSISLVILSHNSFVIPSQVNDLAVNDNLPLSNHVISRAQIQPSENILLGKHLAFINSFRRKFIIMLVLIFEMSLLSSFFLNSIPPAKPKSILNFNSSYFHHSRLHSNIFLLLNSWWVANSSFSAVLRISWSVPTSLNY